MKPRLSLKKSLLLIAILSLAGCNKYYKAISTNEPPAEAMKKFIIKKRHFVLHDSSFVYEIKNIHFNEESREVSCDLQNLSTLRTSYSPHKTYHYKPVVNDSIIQNEIHLHTSYPLTNGWEIQTIIPLSSIYLIEELKFDKKKTNGRKFVAVLATTVGVTAIVATIVAVDIMQDISVWGDDF